MTTSIYALVDPRTNRIRYIGKSIDPRARLKAHLNASAKGGEAPYPSRCWIRKLKALGLRPTLIVIEQAAGDGNEEEVYHIALARRDGIKLLNCTDGGEGSANPGAETRARMAAAKRGRKLSPEHRERIASANRGQRRSPEIIARLVAAQRKRTPESRIKCAAAARVCNIGRKWSRESVERRAAAIRGQKRSPEARAKMSAWQKGKNKSESHRAALKLAHDTERQRLAWDGKYRVWTHNEQQFRDDCAGGATRAILAKKYRLTSGALKRTLDRLGINVPVARSTAFAPSLFP